MKKWVCRLLAVLGVLLIALGLLAGVGNRELLDGDRFAQHVDSVRADPEVSRAIGLQISDRVIEQEPELVALRPLLEAAATNLVASPALGPVVRSTVAPLHRAMVSGESGGVLLTLADIGAVLISAITTLDPNAEAILPQHLDVTLAAFGSGDLTTDLVEVAHLSALVSWLLPALGLLCLIGAGMIRGGGARAWSDTVRRGLVWVAGSLAILFLVVRVLVQRLDTHTMRGAIDSAIWHELEGALWRSVAVVAFVALLVWVVNRPEFTLAPSSLGRGLEHWFTGELTPGHRLVRSGVLVGVGVLLILEPLASLSTMLVFAGLLLAAVAARDLLTSLIVWLAQVLPGQAGRLRQALVSRLALGMALCLMVAVVTIGAWPTDSTIPTADSSDDRCNGQVALCDRRYDQVSFPGTHNSMAAADGEGWFLSEQPTGVMGQLDDGIRLFLVDAWPGQRTDRRGVIANTAASRAEALRKAEEAFGPAGVQSALRLVNGLDLKPRGEVRTYLCHALCELGSTEWTPLMRQVRAWMDRHPREVLTFFVEDYVSPADTAKVFEQAGLGSYLHTQSPGEPWPTLGEMIDSGRRLVVLHERSSDPAVPWLLDGREWVQDTPFTFRSASQFSCDLLRGTPDAPLFLVNHWLSNYQSRIADARRVNSHDVLLDRLRTCESERDHIPNYVAINNYDEGDLFGVVDEINGLADADAGTPAT